jgi:zinc/manganese transport system substrate-binding protein
MPVTRLSRRSFALAPLLLAFAPSLASAADRLPVVASFSILADMIREIGGDRIDLSVLVGPNGDVHVYQPSPADGKAMARAKLIVVNGLGFEGWFERLTRSADAKGTVIAATAGIKPRALPEEDGHDLDREAGGHDHEEADPHAWQSVANAKVYVANIRDGLIAADPGGKATYEANAAAYLAKLDALDGEIRAP